VSKESTAANDGNAANGSLGEGEATTECFTLGGLVKAAFPGLIKAVLKRVSRAAGFLGIPGDQTEPSCTPNISEGPGDLIIAGDLMAGAGDLRSISSISTADSGYSKAVTIGVSPSKVTDSQNALLRLFALWGSRSNGAGLWARCSDGLLNEALRGEGAIGGRVGRLAGVGLLDRLVTSDIRRPRVSVSAGLIVSAGETGADG